MVFSARMRVQKLVQNSSVSGSGSDFRMILVLVPYLFGIQSNYSVWPRMSQLNERIEIFVKQQISFGFVCLILMCLVLMCLVLMGLVLIVLTGLVLIVLMVGLQLWQSTWSLFSLTEEMILCWTSQSRCQQRPLTTCEARLCQDSCEGALDIYSVWPRISLLNELIKIVPTTTTFDNLRGKIVRESSFPVRTSSSSVPRHLYVLTARTKGHTSTQPWSSQ